MPNNQPELPFGEDNPLEDIKRLLETQNELLRAIVDRLTPAPDQVWTLEELEPVLEGDDLYQVADDELDFEEDLWGWDEEDEALPEPPDWFARHFGG